MIRLAHPRSKRKSRILYNVCVGRRLLAAPVLFCYKAPFTFFGSRGIAVELTRKSLVPYVPKKGEEYMNAKQRTHFRKILENVKA